MSKPDPPSTPRGLAAQLRASHIFDDLPTQDGHFVVPEMLFFKLLCDAYEEGRKAGLAEVRAR